MGLLPGFSLVIKVMKPKIPSREIYKNRRLLSFREFEFLKEMGNSKNFFPKLNVKTKREKEEEHLQTELNWF